MNELLLQGIYVNSQDDPFVQCVSLNIIKSCSLNLNQGVFPYEFKHIS